MSRRAATLTVASVLVFFLSLVAIFVPVPYVALRPGPTSDTLGTARGRPLIEITGHASYPADGHLNFTTVEYQGGPGNRIDLFTALRGWLDSNTAVVPEEALFPKNESVKKVEQENTQQMEDSQQSAVAAALRELGIPVTAAVVIDSTQKGMPADGRLRAGDVIVAVDGRKTTSAGEVSDIVAERRPGDTLKITVRRGGKEQTIDVPTVSSRLQPGRAAMGITLRGSFTFPFSVKISVGDIGGPSAGLMFSLAIVEKLTPYTITGGRFIAGTGTIDPDGKVGPIGGIQQKMIAARRAGAVVFLTPGENCADAVRTAPEGLRLIKVTTLHGALAALQAVRDGRGSVPACSS